MRRCVPRIQDVPFWCTLPTLFFDDLLEFSELVTVSMLIREEDNNIGFVFYFYFHS